MRTRIGHLTILLLAVAVVLGAAADMKAHAQAQKGAPAQNDEAALKNAIEDLQKAEARLERVGGTLGGHRASAIEQIKQAQAEVRKALGFVGGQAQSRAGQLDLNTASVSELRALRGVDEATAKKIQAGRPYKKKEDLVEKNVVSREIYNEIKDNVAVAAPKR